MLSDSDFLGSNVLAPPWNPPVHIGQKRKYLLSAMWKPTQTGPNNPTPTPEPARPAAPAPVYENTPSRPAAAATGEQATIGKGLTIKGEINGSESLYIDGKVEGSVNLPGNRVTVGRNGQVAASITAREIVVLGKVRGNVTATDRVDIRAEGSLSGDVAAARISIEDGAFFKGGIDIRKPEGKQAAVVAPTPEPVKVAQ
jgi:cytoskeletal protein CcmA (bactofilin family)